MKGVLDQQESDVLDFERKLAVLGKENTLRFETGTMIAAYLHILRKIVVKDQPLSIQKLFTLDP